MEKRESSFYNVVGGTEDEQNDALGFYEDQAEDDSSKDFEYGGKIYKIEEFERKKTEEETAIVKGIIEKLEEFMKEMGDDKPLKIRPEQVHFLDAEKARAANLPAINFYENTRQFIGIYDSGNNLANAQGVAHEAIHFHSFQVAEIEKDKSVSQRRLGIQIRLRGEQIFYFDEINEAITAELTRIFDKRYLSSLPDLKKEIDERQNFIDTYLRGHPNEEELSEDIAYITTNPITLEKHAAGFAYPGHRKRFNYLIRDIFEKNKKENGGLFEQEDEVFGLFLEAAMAGRLLPIARVIEKTYGKGSFRTLGKETRSPKG